MRDDPELTELLLNLTARQTAAPDSETILLRFLDILDSLDRMVKAAEYQAARPEAPLADRIRADDLRALRQTMVNVFERSGVTFFPSVGRPLDLNCHEVVERRDTPGVEPDTVIEEMGRGCLSQGLVLRCARVAIAHKPFQQDDSGETA